MNTPAPGAGGQALPQPTGLAPAAPGVPSPDTVGLEGRPAAELVGIIRDLRDENAKHRKQKHEAEQKAEADRQAQLTEQGKFRELAEQRAKELDAIKPEHGKLRTTLEAVHKTELAKLPQELRDVIPAGMGVLEQLEFIQTPGFQKLVKAHTSPGKMPPVGGGGPSGTPEAELAAKRDALRKRAMETQRSEDIAAYQRFETELAKGKKT